MRKKQKLEFKTKRSTEIAKKKKYFLVFCVILFVFGAVSVFVFLQSIDFNPDNLFDRKSEETTAAESSTGTPPVLSGSANFLVFCVSDDADDIGDIRFLAVINADLSRMLLRVCAFSPGNIIGLDTPVITLQEHFNRGGVDQLKRAVEKFGGITIDKFAYATDTGFKKAMKSIDKAGSLKLQIEKTVIYKDEFNLFLPAGEHAVNGDILLKYLRFNGTTGNTGLVAQAQAIRSMLDQYINPANAANSGVLFELLFNAMTKTDISGFNYENSKDTIQAIAAAKDTLKTGVETKLTRFSGTQADTTREETTS